MKKILQSSPNFDNEELEAIKEVFKSDWFTEGPKSKEFVSKMNEMIGSNYSVLAQNGTLALYLGLMALELNEGFGVVISDHTFIASANAVLMAGGKPYFIDCGKDLQFDVEKCEEFLKQNKGVIDVIMPVHLWGMACDMDKVTKLAKKHKLFVVEDACQAVGVKWRGKSCGTFGDVGCFSFFADKSLSTIEGGMVTTSDEKLYKKMLYLRNQGRLDRGSFIHPEIGFNFRMNDLQSSMGLVQIEKFPSIIKRRLEIFDLYKKELKDIKKIKILEPPKDSNHIPFRVVVFFEDGKEEIEKYFIEKGIETRTLFFPLHKQPCYEYLHEEDCRNLYDRYFPNSIEAFNKGLCLPVHSKITNEDVVYICNVIKEFYK
jgi:perosamine synthetase